MSSRIVVSFFFFKQKTAYEMRISDWSSDVCSSDLAIDGALLLIGDRLRAQGIALEVNIEEPAIALHADRVRPEQVLINLLQNAGEALRGTDGARVTLLAHGDGTVLIDICDNGPGVSADILLEVFTPRSEENTSELPSLMTCSYAG